MACQPTGGAIERNSFPPEVLLLRESSPRRVKTLPQSAGPNLRIQRLESRPTVHGLEHLRSQLVHLLGIKGDIRGHGLINLLER